MITRVILCVASLFVLVHPTAARAAEEPKAAPVWRYEPAGVGVTLPAGWEWWEDAELEQVNALARSTMGGRAPVYLRGASSTSDPDRYMVIHVTPLKSRSVSYEQLERELGVPLQQSADSFSKSLSDVLTDVQVGSGRLDRSRNLITLRVEMTASGIPLSGLSFGYLTKSDIVFLHCYAPRDKFTQGLSELETMSNAVTVDRGFEFKPGKSKSIGQSALTGAIIGGVVGGILYLNKKLKRRTAS